MAPHGTGAGEEDPSPAVTAFLRALAAQLRPHLVLRHVDPGRPEEDLAHWAAALASIAAQALAILAAEARCGHLAESLWDQGRVLEDVPPIRAPLPDPAAALADHRTEVWLEDRAFGRGPFAPNGWA